MRLALGAALALAVLSCSSVATADTLRSPVDDEGNGSFSGSHTSADHGKGSRDGKNRPGVRDSDEPEDITMFVCDGEATVHSPYDCGSYVPSEDPEAIAAEQLIRRVAVRLQLPKPTPQFGPDPSVNEWNMAAVGYPLWLWTDGPRTVTSTGSSDGMTFTLRARYRSTTFDLGDGHTLRCTDTTRYPKSTKPGTASPTCGYTYRQPAGGDGRYTVTATTHWLIDWSVAGYSGTLPGAHTASRRLPVGELQAIVVK